MCLTKDLQIFNQFIMLLVKNSGGGVDEGLWRQKIENGRYSRCRQKLKWVVKGKNGLVVVTKVWTSCLGDIFEYRKFEEVRAEPLFNNREIY